MGHCSAKIRDKRLAQYIWPHGGQADLSKNNCKVDVESSSSLCLLRSEHNSTIKHQAFAFDEADKSILFNTNLVSF